MAIAAENRIERFTLTTNEWGFAADANGTAAKTVVNTGVELSCPASADEVTYRIGTVFPYAVQDVQAVEFLFNITDTSANSVFGFGIGNPSDHQLDGAAVLRPTPRSCAVGSPCVHARHSR